MSKKILKAMQCPTCGAKLKAENGADKIVCVYCGNTIVPVTESSAEKVSGTAIKVEGMRTPASALAYIEEFFEEYDWEAFSYAQTLTVSSIDALVASLKTTAADDKHTWFAEFKAFSVPYLRKVAGCRYLLELLVEQYKTDDLEAYSGFDAYKRLSAMLVDQKKATVDALEKALYKAGKYGAASSELGDLREELVAVAESRVTVYEDLKEIPAVQAYIQEEHARVVAKLAARGIDAESQYLLAKQLMSEEQYAEALNILLTLKGYAEANTLIKELDRYFLISDALEVEGTLYYFKKNDENLDLHPTEDGKIVAKPLIKGIRKMIAHHANVLYYYDAHRHLKSFNLSTKKNEVVGSKDQYYLTKEVYSYARKAYLFTSKDEESDQPSSLVELELSTGELRTLIPSIRSILLFKDGKVVYKTKTMVDTNAEDNEKKYKIDCCVMDITTGAGISLGEKVLTIEGFTDDYVVYTQDSPDKYNKNLYVKSINTEEPERLIEKNIFSFCAIVGKRLFYYIGNAAYKTLIHQTVSATHRCEWPLYVSRFLFERSGWLYFVRESGYNAVLCRSKPNGGDCKVIAAVDKFIEIKNGYLYYINDNEALVKVRIDGTNSQVLCEDVDEVLSVQEEKIVFVSVDRIENSEYSESPKHVVKSIYSVDFAGEGKTKLVYNVASAKQYDEGSVYYVAKKSVESTDETVNHNVNLLYKLDVETNTSQELLVLNDVAEEEKTSTAALWAVIAAIMFILGIAFAGYAPGFGVLLILGGLVCGFVAAGKGVKEQKDRA